jgi:hypothetical protein
MLRASGWQRATFLSSCITTGSLKLLFLFRHGTLGALTYGTWNQTVRTSAPNLFSPFIVRNKIVMAVLQDLLFYGF